MYVTEGTVALVGVGATLLIAMIGGFGFVLNRMDRRFADVERELVEVKVAVARIEGPRPQFIHGR